MTPTPTMTLRAFVENFYVIERPIGRTSKTQLLDMVRLLCKFAEREVTLADLDENLASRWVAWLESQDYAAETCRGKRRMLMAVWRYAADMDLVSDPRARRVRKIRKPSPVVYAWTLDEIGKLLAAVDVVFSPEKMTENCPRQSKRFWDNYIVGVQYRGIDPRLYWRAYIRVAFDSGARLGDVLSILKSDIDGDGVLVIRQQKTGQPVVCQLSPETMQAIHATFTCTPKAASRDVLFPWAKDWRQKFHARFRTLVNAAGIRKGTTKFLRRSRATYGERDQPGLARRLLGHSSSDTWRRYVDTRVAYGAPPAPPQIVETLLLAGPGKDGAP